MKTMIYPVVVLALAIIACGSSNSGTLSATSAPNAAAPAVAPTMQIYKVGDVITVGTQSIVLNSAQVSGQVLIANFTVENKGTDDLNVSSLLSFEAKNGDGTKLDQEIMNCPSGGLDGKVLAGDKLKGNICWSGAVAPTRIYYSASLFGSGAVVWEVSQ